MDSKHLIKQIADERRLVVIRFLDKLSSNDKYVCEGCCERYGINWKNQEKFSDEEGYLINNKELLDKLSKE